MGVVAYKDKFYAGSINEDTKADQSLLAPIQATLTASKAYIVGEQFVYNGLLYKVTQAILSGETIVIGTNAELAPSVTEQIRYNLGTPQAITSTADYTVPHDGYIRAYFNYNDVGKYGMEFFLNSIKFAAMADVKTAAGYGGAQSLYVPKGTVIKFYDTTGVYNIYYIPNMNR